MGALYVPPSIIEPAVVEDYTAPQIYADGGIVRIGPETCHTICYRAYVIDSHVELREVARIIQPRSSFDASLTRAWLIATGPIPKDGERH